MNRSALMLAATVMLVGQVAMAESTTPATTSPFGKNLSPQAQQAIQGINQMLGNPLGLPTPTIVSEDEAEAIEDELEEAVDDDVVSDEDIAEAVDEATITPEELSEQLAEEVESLKQAEADLLEEQLSSLNRRKEAVKAQMAELEKEAQLLTTEIETVESRQANLYIDEATTEAE